MDHQLLEVLLHQDESETLDFKLQQYPFDRASDDEKGELLKDLLAFANAWKNEDAHILVGVQEVRGGRSIVRGIASADHLLNRNLQQFVHSKTNRPVDFSYSRLQVDNLEIAVFTIPVQERPVYLTKPYGRLEANTVYIRRKDVTGVANPDEIARMGAARALKRDQPSLEIEFADLKVRKKLGTSISVESKVIQMPNRSRIPSYGDDNAFYHDPLRNPDYYRELAEYYRSRSLLSPVGVVVSNLSSALAEEIRVTFRAKATEGLVIVDPEHLPEKPSKVRFVSGLVRQEKHRVSVDRYGGEFEGNIHIGDVQPKTTHWSQEPFYVGATGPHTINCDIQLSGNNLSAPIKGTGEITIQTVTVNLRLDGLLRLTNEEDQ